MSTSASLNLTRIIGTKTATRVRGSATVDLDVIKIDTGLPGAGSFVLTVCDEQFPIVAGTNTVTFAFDVAPDYGSNTETFLVNVEAKSLTTDNVASAWASIIITQCDLLLDSSGSVTTDPLTMTPFAVVAQDNGDSGGSHIPKAGALASATVIEVVGYYPADASELDGAANFYAPRWLVEADYVAVDAAAAIPVFGEGAGHEGDWGWFGGNAFDCTIPTGQWSICKVTIDGGAPVFALLCNAGGV